MKYKIGDVLHHVGCSESKIFTVKDIRFFDRVYVVDGETLTTTGAYYAEESPGRSWYPEECLEQTK